MMNAALAVLLAFLALAAILLARSLRHCLKVFQPRKIDFSSDAVPLPRAMVVLCLRGSDPFLIQTLRGLRDQSHRDFLLRIILDSAEDPAAALLRQFEAERGKLEWEVQTLLERRTDCTLKISSLVQATGDLGDCQRIVMLDADAVPYRDWLADLLRPLQSPRMGAVSGLRWFDPRRMNPGSLIRMVWGAAAVLQMIEFRILWGGSLAMRRDAFEHANVRELWTNSPADDVRMSDMMLNAGFDVCHTPVLLINRESTSFSGCCSFIRRQMLMVRTGHACWPSVLLFATLHGVGGMGLFVLMAAAMLQGNWPIVFWGSVGLALYTAIYCTCLIRLKWKIQKRSGEQGVELGPIRHQLIPAAILTAVVSPWITLAAACARTVRWRGVTYRIQPDGSALMVVDEPVQRVGKLADGSVL